MKASDSRLTRVMAAASLFAVIEYAYWAGVLIYAYDEGGPGLAGIVLLLQLLPAAILAAPLGAYAERFPRGTALSLSYAMEGLFLVLLAAAAFAGAPLALIVGLSALATIAVSVARPLHFAALPQLAPTPKRLVRANAGSSLTDGLGVFIGPAIAGLLAQIAGLWLVSALSAVAMLTAAALTVRLGLPMASTSDDDADEGALSGVRAVARDRPILILLLLVGLSYVVTGSFEILGVAFATDTLGGAESTSGVMIGAAGIGVLIGSIAAAGLAMRAKLALPVVVSLGAAGLPLLVMAAVGRLPVAVALLTLCGIGIAVSSVAARTLLQRTTDAGLLARVFAVQEAVLLLGLSLGALIGPALIAWVGAAYSYLPVGLALIGTALLTLPAIRRLDLRAVFRPDVVAVLRRVDFLVALPPPAVDRLSQSADWLEIATETAVITQGDVGDAYYVVESGRLSVTVDGVVRNHTLVAGEGFGEIALLHDVPRTATITSIEPCRLLRIERDDFLTAVTGNPDGHLIAHEVATAHLTRDADNAR